MGRWLSDTSKAETPDGAAPARAEPHPLRAAILDEVHARPFTPLRTPSRILHFGFMTDEAQARDDRRMLTELCRREGAAPPLAVDKHFRAVLGDLSLRWEQHSEFTTCTWEISSWESAGTDPGEPFAPAVTELQSRLRLLPAPGPLLVAVDLHIVPEREPPIPIARFFSRPSLAIADNSDGSAIYATDFRTDDSGFVRILVVDRGLEAERAGALVQRLLEVETYRTLALLGLPEAQRLSPSIARIERRLAEVTSGMAEANDLASNHHLLDELTALAADLEAGAAASVFRFGATRAYDEIMHQRLETIGERKASSFPTWTSFLTRRMGPAMRTCLTTESRQAALSLKLSRAADLLRTRVNVELEKQNQDLLKSMNARTQMQLRLQSTVEGLSVAAITYYVVGLFGYLAKALHEAHLVPFEPAYLIAGFIPVAALAIWLTVRRIRKHHLGNDH
jgi:uncharacterized membrane-anchored protein